MKKRLLSILIVALLATLVFSLVACNGGGSTTLEKLESEYGVVVDGGSFEEGSTLVSNEIVATTEEATAVLTAIAEQNYNKEGSVYIFDIYVAKDGAKVQPTGKVKVSIPVPNTQVDKYLVFHVKDDNSVEKLVPTVADGIISFETSSFSYFVITEAIPEHVHSFGSWLQDATTENKHFRECKCGEVETGECEFDNGVVIKEASGKGGFGYDPIFFLPELGKTFADLSAEEKNAISHRGKAVEACAKKLCEIIKE